MPLWLKSNYAGKFFKYLHTQFIFYYTMTNTNHNVAKRVGMWALGFLALAGIVYGLIKLGENGAPAPSSDGDKAAVPVAASDHVRGDRAASTVLIEYSDFQCPACGAFEPFVRQLSREFGSRLALVYRNFHLQQHQYSHDAAYAAEAADRQGKFWEYHDKLFDAQTQWSDNPNAAHLFEQYARELGLNVDQFKTDRGSAAVKTRVSDDQASGARAGVNSTPTFFLNGTHIQPRSLDELRDLVGQAVNAAPAATVPTAATTSS